MAEARDPHDVEMHRAMADAVRFAKNMGTLTLGRQATPWSIADHVMWCLRNDGWDLVRGTGNPTQPRADD